MTAPGTGDADRREDDPAVEGAQPSPPAPSGSAPSGWAPSGWGEASWQAGSTPGYGRPVSYGQAADGQATYGPAPAGPTPYGQPPTYGGAPADPSGSRSWQPATPPPGSPPPAPPAAPGSGAPQYGAPQYGAPQYGAPQYGAPQYGAPQYGTPQYGAPQYGAPRYDGAFRPPPVQPGIVPLRPLSMTEIYDGAFRAIRVNPRVMFGFSALVVLVMSVLGGLTQWALIPPLSRALVGTSAEVDPSGQLGFNDTFAASLATVGLLPWSFVAGAVLTGLLTGSVSRSVIGQKVTVAELWQRHWRRTLLLLVVTIVQMVLVLVLLALAVGAVVALAVADQPGLAVVAGLVLLPGVVVLLVWVGTRLVLLPPALVLEGNGVVASVQRAWRLTRGSFWRVLGIYLLAAVIVSIVGQVLAAPMGFVAAFTQPDVTSPGFIFLTTLLSGLAQAISTVFLAAVVALLYVDLRIRREGLDVELARAAEAAAQGGASDGPGVSRS